MARRASVSNYQIYYTVNYQPTGVIVLREPRRETRFAITTQRRRRDPRGRANVSSFRSLLLSSSPLPLSPVPLRRPPSENYGFRRFNLIQKFRIGGTISLPRYPHNIMS